MVFFEVFSWDIAVAIFNSEIISKISKLFTPVDAVNLVFEKVLLNKGVFQVVLRF